MTLSDAEEDQPSQNRDSEAANIIIRFSSVNSTTDGPLSIDRTSDSSPIAADRTITSPPSIYETANSLPTTHTSSLNESSPLNNQACKTIVNSNLIMNDQSNSAENTSDQGPNSAPVVNGNTPEASDNLTSNSMSENTDSTTRSNANPTTDLDLEYAKVKEKLEQIERYIDQTTNAMQALENEANMSKIGQYNTLVKVMKDLKSSQANLTAHLKSIKEKIDHQSLMEVEDNIFVDRFEAQFAALQIQETECFNLLNQSLKKIQNTADVANGETASEQIKESGSESIGTVRLVNEDGSGGAVSNRPTLHERLNIQQSEQEQLSSRLRESLVRRQELMVRYQATRDRLNNLKRQRTSLAIEERDILHDAGAPQTPYEDPIPGAESWSELQLENSIEDFRLLRNKVDSLHEAYNAKVRATDESDTETMADLQRKLEQIVVKRNQIGNAITRMLQLLDDKRQSRTNGDGTIDEAGNSGHQHLENVNESSTIPIRAPTEDTVDLMNQQETTGAAALPESSQELLTKQQHLQSLKDQLASMKQLLKVTQDTMPVPPSVSARFRDAELEETTTNDNGEELESTVVGVNGDLIHLSETERRDPLVVSKFRQLELAKKRLAKMEEVMNLIAEARDSGKPIHEILSPENLAILEEAQEEERLTEMGSSAILDEPPIVPLSQVSSNGDPLQTTSSNRTPRELCAPIPPSRNRNRVNEFQDPRTDWERDREISAMQYRLKKKTTSGVSSINDGSRQGREKGAVKKQTRSLFGEGNDPRVTEVLVLQEELKEKKNALEALMKKMGKSSSFATDNFSDNISENVSDLNSETYERPTASWGDARYLSDPSPSDVDAVNVPNDVDLNSHYDARRTASYPGRQPCALPKNRDRLNANKPSGNTQFSVNNLSGTLPRSVRPKQNRAPVSEVPVASWENVPGNINRPTQDTNSNKVQNTVFSAMSQLTQVQETINSLYEELRNAEKAASVQPEVPGHAFLNSTSGLQPNIPFSTNPQTMMSNYQQMPVINAVNAQATSGASNPMLAGLQQCFSQLYLHSLEIQSLNKHLQMIDQRESSNSPSHRRGVVGQRSSTDRLQRDCDQRFSPNTNFGVPSFNDDKQESYLPRPADVVQVPQNEVRNPTGGISNPLYATINAESQLNWNDSSDKNYFSPFNDAANMRSKNDSVIGATFPVDAERRSPWAPMRSMQINNHHQQQQQQQSDILNNQVLPGTRANNYWDNFRSYSHQNPLSTAAKSNTGERRAGSSNSLPGVSPSCNRNERLIPGSTSFENRQYNVTSGSNHSINKASDKNSSTTRCQNRSRSRYSLPTDSRMSNATDSHSFNLVTSPTPQRQRNRKRNNRLNYGGSSEQEECFRNYRLEAPDLAEADSYQMTENDCERRLGSHGRYETDEQFLIRLNHQNTTSQEDLSTSETHSQVIREAESLMKKHSEQPEFLLQLFHHASRITGNTDQHVALELLRELSSQRQQSNIQHNRWNSNSSVTPSENLSIDRSVTTREERSYRNNTRLANKNRSRRGRGISGSDASESGITSDEEEIEPKGAYRSMKNITPLSPGLNPSQRSSPQNYSGPLPSCLRMSPIPPLASKCGLQKEPLNAEFNGRIKFENQNIVDRNQRSKRDSDNASRNLLLAGGSSHLQNSNSFEQISARNEAELRFSEDVFGRKKQSPRREMTQGEERQTNFVLKNRQKNFNVKPHMSSGSSQGGFESIVSAALREVLRVFEWPENNMTSNVQVLETLHQSIMKQVQMQSSSMGFSANFVSSIEAQLKTTLQGFYGKRISQIRQELAATVTQVLIHQYCSLLVHQDNSNDYIQPQTPDANHVDENRFEAEKIASGSRLYNNQPCVNSLFSSSDGVMKSARHPKQNWSYNHLSNERDDKHSMGSAPTDEAKNSPKNIARNRGGAIAKTPSLANNDRSSKRGGESPIPDASFPEAWIASKPLATASHFEATATESNSQRSRSCDNAESNQTELVESEADQRDLIRSQEFLGGPLPGHDLAEADQSQDAIEAEGIASSTEDDVSDLGLYAQPQQQQDSPGRHLGRRNLVANAGLDEVPTRLMSGPDGASPPLPNNIGNRHPPEGGAGSNDGRTRGPPVLQYADGRHPPEGGGAQAVQSNYQQDSSGKSG